MADPPKGSPKFWQSLGMKMKGTDTESKKKAKKISGRKRGLFGLNFSPKDRRTTSGFMHAHRTYFGKAECEVVYREAGNEIGSNFRAAVENYTIE